MPKPIRDLTLLSAALLFTGCGDESTKQTPDAASGDTTPTQAEADEQATHEQEAEPTEQKFEVLDAAGIKALREQAADRDQVLVIDVWATWCPSCVAMFPKLHAAMKERGDKVKLVSLCYDENSPNGPDFVAKAKEFITAHHAWDGAYLAASGEAKDELPAAMGGSWDDGVLPAVFVYGPDGALVHEMLATEGDVDQWVAGIGSAVDQAASE